MPWVAVPKRSRKPGALGRWRADHHESLFGWVVGIGALVVLLALLFLLAHKLA